MPKFLNGSVTDVKHWNQRLCTLKVTVDFPPFEAGQFVSIGLEVDNKPYMRYTVAKIIAETLESLDLKYPTVDDKAKQRFADMRARLTNEE